MTLSGMSWLTAAASRSSEHRRQLSAEASASGLRCGYNVSPKRIRRSPRPMFGSRAFARRDQVKVRMGSTLTRLASF